MTTRVPLSWQTQNEVDADFCQGVQGLRAASVLDYKMVLLMCTCLVEVGVAVARVVGGPSCDV